MKKIFIVGSTGALGKESLNVIRDNKESFNLVGIAGFNNYQEAVKQCLEFEPRYVGIRKEFLSFVKNSCGYANVFDVKKDLANTVLEANPDITLFLSSGISAIKPILTLLKKGKTVGIANKESIIAGGNLIFKNDFPGFIIPIDSEPSAIFQAMLGENKKSVRRLIITGSGGSFRDLDKELLADVSSEDALKHPNWKMGKKITIDSATMVNKAFEVIESHFLFGIDYKRIEVIIHRESIVHSLVEFIDGNIKAILSPTRMYYPIQFALTYPNRNESHIEYLNLTKAGKLTFYEMDHEKFPAFRKVLNIAKTNEGLLPVLTASDEVAVQAFLDKKIKFTDIENVITETATKFDVKKIDSAEQVEELYKNAIMTANKIVRRRMQ